MESRKAIIKHRFVRLHNDKDCEWLDRYVNEGYEIKHVTSLGYDGSKGGMGVILVKEIEQNK